MQRHLPFQPESSVIASAGGAMAVSTGMTGRMRMTALGTVPELAAGFRRTAAGQIAQDLPVSRRHAFVELLDVRQTMAADDIRQRAHL